MTIQHAVSGMRLIVLEVQVYWVSRACLRQEFLAVGNEHCPTQRHNRPVAFNEFVLQILEQ